MKKTVSILLVLIIQAVLNLNAQTSKYWGHNYVLIGFDSSSGIRNYQYDLFNTFGQYSNGINMSSPNGDLMFLGGNIKVCDHKGLAIKNSERLFVPKNGLILQSDENRWNCIGFHCIDTNYFAKTGKFSEYINLKRSYCYDNIGCFDSFEQKVKFGFYNTELKRDLHNIGYVDKKMQYSNDFPSSRIDFYDVRRVKNYQYQILGLRRLEVEDLKLNKSFGLYLFSFQNGDLNLDDSIVVTMNSIIPDSLKLIAQNYILWTNINYAHINRSIDRIIMSVTSDIQYSGNKLYTISAVLEFECDATSKKIDPEFKILDRRINFNPFIFKKADTIVNYTSNGILSVNSDCFSPNDSICYLFKTINEYDFGDITKITNSVIAWKYKIEGLNEAKTIYSTTTLNSQYSKYTFLSKNINPFGGLTMVLLDNSNPGNFINKYIHFKNANEPRSFIEQNYSMVQSGNIGQFQNTTLHNYDYLRIKKNLTYKNCKAYFSSKNISDLSNGINKFTWIISKNAFDFTTEFDTLNSVDFPETIFEKSGKYLLKLLGESNNAIGYQELYIDTVDVRIPQKPILNFSTIDTILCSHNEAKFKSSVINDIKLNDSFYWDFGDGQYSYVQNPRHIYKDTGTYSVKLYYDNGYCGVNKVQRHYIKVIESPPAGFFVSDSIGCTPFKITINDNVKGQYLQSKQYHIDGNSNWLNIKPDSFTFTYTFTNAGVFKIKQRLIGKNGCKVENDSIFVTVHKGFNQNDSLYLINSTVEDNKVLLNWSSLGAAVKYKVFVNSTYLDETSDTVFTHPSAYNGLREYYIVGVDQCSNQIQSYNVGGPIFLKGELLGFNEFIKLEFSNYLKWKDSSITYVIQRYKNNNWVELEKEIDDFEYIDGEIELNSSDGFQYRIEAYNTYNKISFTHSNIVTIHLMPLVFMPNAFSPNMDGFNDTFSLKYYGITSFKLKVFNRWGNMIFNGRTNESWSDTELESGVYVMIVDYTTDQGRQGQFKQTIHLLK